MSDPANQPEDASPSANPESAAPAAGPRTVGVDLPEATSPSGVPQPAGPSEDSNADADSVAAAGGAPSPTPAANPAEATPPRDTDEPTSQVASATVPPAGAGPRLKIGSQRKTPAAKPPQAKPVVPVPASPTIERAAENKRKNFPPPNIREKLSPELEAELEAALGDASLDDLIGDTKGGSTSEAGQLAAESQVSGKVISVHRDDVFVDLGGRDQGIVPLKQFDEPPEVGSELDLIVSRFNADDGLYECGRPGKAVSVGNWEDVEEGAVVEVDVTGSNKGGLECEVASIRGFIPMGQISTFRVENPEEYVGQRLACVVTEANRDRRNLVLSHRAVMERERAIAREKLLTELAVGQVRDGIVKTIKDFGAFVDLGGVDGLIHISQLSWDRVAHPSEILSEGQAVKVKIEKIDSATGKIGLAYRDLAANPWDNAKSKYVEGARVTGTVSKVMDFGAFVRLEAGVEGLIHISELSHARVWRTSDAVSEGQEVEVKIVSVDTEKQRIGLSLKALQAAPKKVTTKEGEAEFETPKDVPKPPPKQHGQLKGGVGRPTGGDKFGLKW